MHYEQSGTGKKMQHVNPTWSWCRHWVARIWILSCLECRIGIETEGAA
jgi:hypothetical protein